MMLVVVYLAAITLLVDSIGAVTTTAAAVPPAYTPPDVNLTSCLGKVAIFTITNMVSGGLIYIRTKRGAFKVEPSFDTNGEEYIYQCNFDECGIEWYEKFTFISQRHVNIQTVHDQHKTFICLADLLSISPGGGSTSDANATELVRYLYRASASMNFYDSEGTELESGSFVKLGTQIDIYINLTNNIGDMFDLSVKSCDVILLPIISDRCPVDGDMFDQFTKLSVGYLYNNFSMFRPTTTVQGAMDVLFSCTLEICRNPCPTYICNGTEAILQNETDSDSDVSSRRKRQVSSPRNVRSVKLGTIFRVDYEEPVPVEPSRQCMSTNILLAVFTSLGVILIATVVFMVHYTLEWKRMSKHQSKSHNVTAATTTTIRTAPVSQAATEKPVNIITASHSDRRQETVGNIMAKMNIATFDNTKTFTDTKMNGRAEGQKLPTTAVHRDVQRYATSGAADEPLHNPSTKSISNVTSLSQQVCYGPINSNGSLKSNLRKSLSKAETTRYVETDHKPSRNQVGGDIIGDCQEQNASNIQAVHSPKLSTSKPEPSHLKSALKTSNPIRQDIDRRNRSASDAIPKQTKPLQKQSSSPLLAQQPNNDIMAIQHRIASEVIAKELDAKPRNVGPCTQKGPTYSDQDRSNVGVTNEVGIKKIINRQLSTSSLPSKPHLEYNSNMLDQNTKQKPIDLHRQVTEKEILYRQRSISEAVSAGGFNKDGRSQSGLAHKQLQYARETENNRTRSSSAL